MCTYLKTKGPNGNVYMMSRTERPTYSLSIHTIIASSVDFALLWFPGSGLTTFLCHANIRMPMLQAYILSRGKKHWKTMDRGKLWQSFELPVKPAMVANPLAFHADKKKGDHVLYHGTRCEGTFPWVSKCGAEVRTCLACVSSCPLSVLQYKYLKPTRAFH
jgi:ferredoxin